MSPELVSAAEINSRRDFMETVLANLPAYEKAYLAAQALTVLDWGCDSGEGILTLARAFPGLQVAGLDSSRSAIDRARTRNPGYEFIWSEDGAIPRDFEVIVAS